MIFYLLSQSENSWPMRVCVRVCACVCVCVCRLWVLTFLWAAITHCKYRRIRCECKENIWAFTFSHSSAEIVFWTRRTPVPSSESYCVSFTSRTYHRRVGLTLLHIPKEVKSRHICQVLAENRTELKRGQHFVTVRATRRPGDQATLSHAARLAPGWRA